MTDNLRRDHHPFHVWESLERIPELLSTCLGDEVKKQINAITAEISKREIDHLFLVGTGSSYFASIVEQYAFEKIAGISASSFVTSVFKAFPPCNLDPKAAVFFHSHSGNTEGDVDGVYLAKDKGAYTIGVTDIATSDLARGADACLIGPGGGKIEKPATRTYTTAIFRMLLLAISLGKTRGNQRMAEGYEANLGKLPEAVRLLLSRGEDLRQTVVKELESCSTLIVVGYGPNRATADEAAMAFNQSTGIPSQSYELDNYIHGPMQALKKGMGVFVIAAPGALQARSLSLAQACKTIGARVVLFAPEDCPNIPGGLDHILRLPGGLLDLASPVAYMIPLWQMAYYMGLAGKGAHPDRLSMDKPEFQEAFRLIMEKDQWVRR